VFTDYVKCLGDQSSDGRTLQHSSREKVALSAITITSVFRAMSVSLPGQIPSYVDVIVIIECY